MDSFEKNQQCSLTNKAEHHDSGSGSCCFSETHSPANKKSHYKDEFDEICVLGQGGYGIVMKVKNKNVQQQYAIKIVELHHPLSDDSNECLLQEAKVLAGLNHPNVVRYHASWIELWNKKLETEESSSGSHQDDNDTRPMLKSSQNQSNSGSNGVFLKVFYLFIQMELCVGPMRSEILGEGVKINSDYVANLLYQIVQGLNYVHSKGFIHRDLNPNNIFLDVSGRLKIGDFGLARLTEICQKSGEKSALPLSADVGTRLYKAPEIISDNYDYRVDLYSLGVILFEMSYPMKTVSERNQVLEKLRKPEITFPPDFSDHASEWQMQLSRLLLQHSANHRPSLDQILQQLSEVHPLPDINIKEVVDLALKDPASYSRRQVLQSCFNQEAQYKKIRSYGASNFNQSVSTPQSLIIRCIENIFKKYGAIHKATPLLTPGGLDREMTSGVHLLTQDGIVVNLPYNSKVNLAWFVVLNEINSLTRYDTLHTYEENISCSHPNQNCECVYDIVTSCSDNLVADAHIISVLMAIFNGILPEENTTNLIAISHSELVKAVVLSVGVNEQHLSSALQLIGRNGLKDGLMNLKPDQLKESRLDVAKLDSILELSGEPHEIENGLMEEIDTCYRNDAKMAFEYLKKVLMYHQNIIGHQLQNVEISMKWCGNVHYYSGILFTGVHRRDVKKKDIIIADGGRFDVILNSIRAELGNEGHERDVMNKPQYGVGISVYPLKVHEIRQDFWPELVIITCRPNENLENHVYNLARQLRTIGFNCREEFNPEGTSIEAYKRDKNVLCLAEYLPSGDINVTHKLTNLNQTSQTLSIGSYNPQPPTIKIPQEDVLAMFQVTDMVAEVSLAV